MCFRYIFIGFVILNCIGCSKKLLSESNSSSTAPVAPPKSTPFPIGKIAYHVYLKNGKFFVTNEIGISISEDNGKNWITTRLGCQTNCGGSGGGSGIAMTNNGFLFVGTKTGVAKSIDGGQTWSTPVSVGLLNASVNELYTDGTKLFARTYVGISGRGFSTSDNYGVSWTNHQYPDLLGNDNIFAFLATQNNQFYLAINSTPELKRSVDGGGNWTEILPPSLTNTGASSIISAGDKIILATNLGVYISDDNGTSWIVKTSANGLAYTSNSMVGYDGTQKLWALGFWQRVLSYSTDFGQTWTQKNTLTNLSFYPNEFSVEGSKMIIKSSGASGPAFGISIDGGETFTYYK